MEIGPLFHPTHRPSRPVPHQYHLSPRERPPLPPVARPRSGAGAAPGGRCTAPRRLRGGPVPRRPSRLPVRRGGKGAREALCASDWRTRCGVAAAKGGSQHDCLGGSVLSTFASGAIARVDRASPIAQGASTSAARRSMAERSGV